MEQAYRAALAKHGYEADAAQLRVVALLGELQRKLESRNPTGQRLLRLLRGGNATNAPRGIYLYGEVGRGKTFLMDLFFDTLQVERKTRIHFHRMMRDIHLRLRAIAEEEDPLDIVAADIARDTQVLCFDEFFVSDIGDAMILGRLLDGLFRRGVTMIATSNAKPADLYRNGLQRERFLPAIALLEAHTTVVDIGGETDYRLKLLQTAGTYLTPDDDTASGKLAHYFSDIASGTTHSDHTLNVLGRDIRTIRCAKGIVWFAFDSICDGPRSQDDYIEIARWFPTVIVSGVPLLTRHNENAARRFIALVDEFYDRKVKLIVSAAAGVDSLYQGERLQFEFQRTRSRLTEMQSDEYLHEPHLA